MHSILWLIRGHADERSIPTLGYTVVIMTAAVMYPASKLTIIDVKAMYNLFK